MIKKILSFFYSSLFVSLSQKDIDAFALALKNSYVPSFIKKRLYKELIYKSLSESFTLGVWHVFFNLTVKPSFSKEEEKEIYLFLAEGISTLSSSDFYFIKEGLKKEEGSFLCPPWLLYNPKQPNYSQKLTESLFVTLNRYLTRQETISLIQDSNPWGFRPHKIASLYWLQLESNDIGKSLRFWSYLVSIHPSLFDQYLEFVDLLLKQNPYSFVLQTLKKQKCVLHGSLEEKVFTATSIEEVFPLFSSRAIKSSLFHNPGLFLDFQSYEKSHRSWMFEGYDLIHQILDKYKVDTQLFLRKDYTSFNRLCLKYGHEHVYYKILNILEHCKQVENSKIASSTIEEWMSGETCEIGMCFDLMQDTSREVLKKMIFENPTWTLNTFVKNLQKYHEIRPDLVLVQPTVQKYHNKKFVHRKKEYEIIVPSISQELIDVGNILKNCVGNGDYANAIIEEDAEIFFIKTNGKISHCIQVEEFEIVEACGYKNRPMGKELLKKLEKEMNLEESDVDDDFEDFY